MRILWLILGVALLASTAAAAPADNFFAGGSAFNASNDLVINGSNFYNSDSGWFNNTGLHEAGNTNYITGFCAPGDCGGYYYHSYFSFDLSDLDTSVTSASFTVDSYLIQYDSGTFLLYGTSLSPADVASGQDWSDVGKYNSLTSGPLVGSISLSPSDSFTFVTVTLNSNGLLWLNENAGDEVVLGGNWSASEGQVPEPGSLMLLLLGTGVLSLAGAVRRVKG